MKAAYCAILIYTCLLSLVVSWSPADHEIFRLRDEIAAAEGPDVTFYDFLGVERAASQDDISKAYRKKSRLIHPDKAKQSFIASRAQPNTKTKSGKKPGVHVSKPPSDKEIQAHVKKASDRFARLGVIAKILKGPGRERYDFFLSNGFPTWRGTGYYYARFRPGLGTVLVGLFVLGGGGAHYAALYLSWKRQKEFVERYIRRARRAAWGDEVGIKGIPGIDSTASSAQTESAGENTALNRRQKRLQEKENKKESKKGRLPKRSGTSTPLNESEVESAGPQGARKKVQAENGKILIVDSVGNVYLEEDDENGEKGEFLLDPNEITKPTWRQTILISLPVSIYSKAKNTLLRRTDDLGSDESEDDDAEQDVTESLKSDKNHVNGKNTSNRSARKRRS